MRERQAVPSELGDFTATARVLTISALAIGIGFIASYVALGLLKLIGLFTNLFFYQRWNSQLVSPAGSPLGWMIVFVPIVGGLIVGLMARYGSDRIRGHGIPEAIEAILINGSRVEPKVAVLKPLSSAISIGSGGPFGAEGPIIMTGGAIGSLIAQLFHLTSAERKTLLVAGAAAGMSATFAAPVASVLLAVELLLFEWKPRSMVPVALASATAAAARRYLLGLGPIFPVPAHPIFIGPAGTRRVRRLRPAGGRPLSSAYRSGLRRGRRLPEAADPLDVVAGDRRSRDRAGRSALPAGARRRLRHDLEPAYKGRPPRG